MTLLCDTNHVLSSDYSTIKAIGAGADAVDIALINLCRRGDVVITQDYGVAALALGKGARAIHQSGRWYLSQHAEEPDVRFNILYGGYDYVVLQEHAHPFGPEEKFLNAAVSLNEMIRKAGSTPIIYECWSRKDEPEKQKDMVESHKKVAAAIHALRAPVGENWWSYKKSWPDLESYAEDGAHASPAGSDFAAKHIWEEIVTDLRRKGFI